MLQKVFIRADTKFGFYVNCVKVANILSCGKRKRERGLEEKEEKVGSCVPHR